MHVPSLRLPTLYRVEADAARSALDLLDGALEWDRVAARATVWIEAVRRGPVRWV